MSSIIRNGVCATQMSAQKGIKFLGDKAVSAIIDEYEQLDRLNVFLNLYIAEI